jgi:hypothetical protein
MTSRLINPTGEIPLILGRRCQAEGRPCAGFRGSAMPAGHIADKGRCQNKLMPLGQILRGFRRFP